MDTSEDVRGEVWSTLRSSNVLGGAGDASGALVAHTNGVF